MLFHLQSVSVADPVNLLDDHFPEQFILDLSSRILYLQGAPLPYRVGCHDSVLRGHGDNHLEWCKRLSDR